jgi:methyl-accepting chemotaxis protein
MVEDLTGRDLSRESQAGHESAPRKNRIVSPEFLVSPEFPQSVVRSAGEITMMKALKEICVGASIGSAVLPFCIGVLILLAAALPGCDRIATPHAEPERAAVREVQELAQAAGVVLNLYMDARITEMLMASKLGGPLRDALSMPEARADANRILMELLSTSEAFEAILIVDKTGACVASAPTGLVNRNFSRDQAFQEAIGGRLAVTDLHKSDDLISLNPKSKGWTAVIAVPVTANKEVAGVLMSLLKWSHLEQLVKNIKVVRRGYVIVLNKSNQVIVHPSENLYGMSLTDPGINRPDLDDAIRHRASYTRYNYKTFGSVTDKSGTGAEFETSDTKLIGLAYPTGYGNFPGLGWAVGATVDESELAGEKPRIRFTR